MDSLHEFVIPADYTCWKHVLAVFEGEVVQQCAEQCVYCNVSEGAGRKVAPKNSEARVSSS